MTSLTSRFGGWKLHPFAAAVQGAALLGLAAVPAAVAQESEEPRSLGRMQVVGSFGTERTQIGTFRDLPIVDVPLTVNVVPRGLIEAQQAQTLYEALKNTAGVTRSQLGPTIYSNIAIRGITVENRSNFRLNGGLPVINLIDLPLENKERVEVLKGSAGLYYGLIPPSGLINLVTKRAGPTPVNEVTLTANEHGGYGIAADFARQAGGGTFGWRVNAAASHVGEAIEDVEGRRQFASVALDYKPLPAWTLKFDAEVIRQDSVEQASLRVPNPVNGVITLPRLPDPTRLLTGSWARYVARAENLLLRSDYNVADDWVLTAEIGRARTARPDRAFTQIEGYDIDSGAGTARTFVQCCQEYVNEYARVEAFGMVHTGPVLHEPSIGYQWNRREQTSGASVQVTQPQNIYDPVPLAEPSVDLPAPVGRTRIDDRGFYVFDRMTYDRWTATAGARYIDYTNTSTSTRYAANRITPSASLAYGFAPQANVYASYIEGFEEGGQAPLTAANALQTLPPLKTRQVEIGAKARLPGGVLVQASLFDIRRPSAGTNTSTNVFEVIGDARYRGVELSANGDITRSWSVYASYVYLDAEITRAASNPALVGRVPENTPRQTASVWSEHRIAAVPGLSLGAGAFYVGRRAVNALNQAFIDDYVRVDAGASYAARLGNQELVLRLLLENVLDRNYWVAAGNNLLAQGLPRTLRAVAQVRF
jgi:iron complex outermembrane receptor protein